MAVAAVETDRFIPAHDTADVVLVPETMWDIEARAEAARFIGSLALGDIDRSAAEPAEHVRPIESLYDAVRLAAEGDERARSMVRINVATDVVERTIKSGHITTVSLDVDEAGRIQQFGQSMESVQANSLRFASDNPQLRARTEAETTNSFRIAELHRQGELEEYNLVVLSRAADDMDEATMQAVGFFTDTMSMAIQVTSAEGNSITTESAFVAGKRTAMSERHDQETVTGLGRRLGIDLSDMSATELLATPLLVHKSVMPNGVIDLVQLYDQAAGDTFFGEARPVQDYSDYHEACRQRERRYEPRVTDITDQLIAEADVLTDRVGASERLHQLSQDAMVIEATVNDTIDPQVFGPAAERIVAARQYLALDDIAAYEQVTQSAVSTAVSTSCPSALRKAMGEQGDNQDSTKDDSPGDCEFVSKECPKCHKKNVKTKISKGQISGDCGCRAKL